MKSLIQSVEVTWLVHATEDPQRVGGAVAELLGTSAPPELVHLTGHFGNKIIRGTVRLSGVEAQDALRHALSRMPKGLKKDVAEGIDSFVDEHSALFLRLDKQGLVAGELALGAADAERLKVKPRAFLLRGGPSEFYRQLIGEAQ